MECSFEEVVAVARQKGSNSGSGGGSGASASWSREQSCKAAKVSGV